LRKVERTSSRAASEQTKLRERYADMENVKLSEKTVIPASMFA
jgi:hypothetical protein